mmetsp:Transcript_29543/g.60513  ORF Transcript_29543/g.60513 Transcript_29543/m.60513 type:complete len:383 (-) Transcript_29543:401-1549(-)|eukprot:CAMPEP_0182523202 /NCGR_PEP_ID=MMETSP1323-20130603/868_1 /TAXON_ID=236787 /ORGANISM="Florenciella parvula, Strain RCC1693" /LENGTH=382 /DNA_ID=CAMNT_0024731507 /DNA_START=84 /DNA_END=1232 /DNA_ORIENTATION=-
MANSTFDEMYSAYLTIDDGIGTPCVKGEGNGQCPPRQNCEAGAIIYDCDGECTEPYQIDRCRCWAFFGHTGDTCEELSTNSYITAAFFVIGSIIALISLYIHMKTMIPVIGQLVQKKLKMNIATTTLFLSTAASLLSAIITCAYVTSSLLIDSELSFERRWIGPLFGVLAMFTVPACLLVCTMWIDVASAGMKRTKAQRAAMQKKVRGGMITSSVILSILFAVLALTDQRSMVSVLCILVFVVVGILYIIGGIKLSNMLASEGKSRPEGLFGTCKTGSTPGMIVVNTAVNISICCFMNIVGGAVYISSPNPISSLGVMILFLTISTALMVIVLYLRFGLRKVLKLDFNLEKGSDRTTTRQNSTEESDQVNTPVGGGAKVAPA